MINKYIKLPTYQHLQQIQNMNYGNYINYINNNLYFLNQTNYNKSHNFHFWYILYNNLIL